MHAAASGGRLGSLFHNALVQNKTIVSRVAANANSSIRGSSTIRSPVVLLPRGGDGGGGVVFCRTMHNKKFSSRRNNCPAVCSFHSTRKTTTSATTTATTTSTATTSRPFRILGIQQIAIGSKDRDPLARLWGDVFGVLDEKTCVRKTIATENVIEDILSLGKHPYQVEVDLMVPIDPEQSPKVHKPPLNHIGLWVDDLERAVEWMDRKGVRFTPGGIRMGAAGHNVTFIHPKPSEEKPISGCGVLIELVQAPPEVIRAYNNDK